MLFKCKNISKRFGRKYVLRDISFGVEKGETVGIVGCNGAGKTVLINILTGLTLPDEGRIFYQGQCIEENLIKYKNEINYSSGYQSLQLQSSVGENLETFAGLYGVTDINKRIDEVSDLLRINITPILKRKLWSLSSGEKGRINFMKALLNKPKILFLDEPEVFVDVIFKSRMIEVIKRIPKLWGTSIIFSSHDFDKMLDVANKVILLDRGRAKLLEKQYKKSKLIKLINE